MKQVFTKNNAITNALRVYNFAVSQIWSDKSTGLEEDLWYIL